jgi:hypothetical protein
VVLPIAKPKGVMGDILGLDITLVAMAQSAQQRITQTFLVMLAL